MLSRLPKLKKILQKQIYCWIMEGKFDCAISRDLYHTTVVWRCYYVIEFGLRSNPLWCERADTPDIPQQVRYLMLTSPIRYVLSKGTNAFISGVRSLLYSIMLQSNTLCYMIITLGIINVHMQSFLFLRYYL